MMGSSLMVRRALDGISDFFFPPRCQMCGRVTPVQVDICAHCQKNLPENLAFILPPKEREDFYFVRAPLHYSGPARAGIIGLKFRERRRAAVGFAQIMAQAPLFTENPKIDWVTAVPLSKKRLRKRGYNQSELIGRQFCLLKGLEYQDGILRKIRENRVQSTIRDARARAENVRGCYLVEMPEAVTGKTVLLIDDVYTTGATMQECARLLRQAGASRVIGLCACTAGLGED